MTLLDRMLGALAFRIVPAVDSPKFGRALRRRIATAMFRFLGHEREV